MKLAGAAFIVGIVSILVLLVFEKHQNAFAFFKRAEVVEHTIYLCVRITRLIQLTATTKFTVGYGYLGIDLPSCQ